MHSTVGSIYSLPFVEQAHSIFYILQVYSNLTLGEGRGEWLLGLFVSEDGGREQETLYYYSVTWDHYIVII
jgi:hypothetical protein